MLHRTRREPRALASRRLDLDIDTSRETELIQSFDCLGSRLDDVNETLVGPNLVLLTSLLVDARTRQDRVSLDSRRQRNWTVNLAVRSLDRIHDLLSTDVEHRVVVCFHTNSNDFACARGHDG